MKFDNAAQAFADQVGPQALAPDVGSGKDDLLEKKWTSVVRLKKKVNELEL